MLSYFQVCNCYSYIHLYYLVATLISPPRSQLEQWHHGGHQLGGGNLGLLPLTLRPTSVSIATVWVSWLLMGCPKWGFLT